MTVYLVTFFTAS